MNTNEAFVIVIMGFYTLAIVYGIHHYEAKIKDLKESIGDYQRALNIARSGGRREDFQYESSTYKDNTWRSSQYANEVELDLNPPYVSKYGPKFDKKG